MTKEQIGKAIKVMNIILDAIKEAGPEGIPSGHLYAMLMQTGMSLESYQRMIEVLTTANRITVSNHVVRYKHK